jgi:SAM-dependent methyltransferase
MPFRSSFDCLWCGKQWTVRGPDDLEGWAQLCPDCVGRAGNNEFLRFRLRQALSDRAGAAGREVGTRDVGPDGGVATDSHPSNSGSAAPGRDPPETSGRLQVASVPVAPAGATRPRQDDASDEMVAYYQARADEYDDWYLRRGRYSHGPIHDAAWNAELDAAGRWLDSLPIRGTIVELAAGTGWWSPLLAQKGELSLYDAAPGPLDRARDRLLAHGLRAHLHVRDAWAEPDRQVDALFAGFWLSHVERDRLTRFLELARRWLKPDGLFAFIDSLPDPQSGASDHAAPGDDRATRLVTDGREFHVVKVFYSPNELAGALRNVGFGGVEVTTTGRFFLLGRAIVE